MPTKPATMTRDQFEIALFRLNPAYAYRWLTDGEYEWRHPDAIPTDAELQAALTAYNNEQAAEQVKDTEANTERTQLLGQIQAAKTTLQVTIDDSSLTAAEVAAAVKFQAQVLKRLLTIVGRAIEKGGL